MTASPGTFAGITGKEVLSIGVAKPGGCNPRALGGPAWEWSHPEGKQRSQNGTPYPVVSFELWDPASPQRFKDSTQ